MQITLRSCNLTATVCVLKGAVMLIRFNSQALFYSDLKVISRRCHNHNYNNRGKGVLSIVPIKRDHYVTIN